jgi:hypothetical protein
MSAIRARMSAVSVTSPYAGRGERFFRGNLHTHTTHSDGRYRVEEVVARYVAAGHDFLAISDHDVWTPPFTDERLVSLPAVEITAGGPHVLAVGVSRAYDTGETRGEITARVVADGGLCVLAHPCWEAHYDHWPQAAMLATGPYHGIEIFNTSCEPDPGSAYALDRWDRLLSAGRRVWGFANDDFHHDIDGPLAFNAVMAEAFAADDLLAAMKAGSLYASSGLELAAIEVTREAYRIEADESVHVRFITRGGVVAQRVDGERATYRFKGDEGYVRAEAWGSGYRAAFTQPVFVERP